MSILSEVDLIRITANEKLDPKKKGALGQFFTSAPIARYMASLFKSIEGDVTVLDPGCGPCSLMAAFVDEAIRRKSSNNINASVYDIEQRIISFATESLSLCKSTFEKSGGKFNSNLSQVDYILNGCDNNSLFDRGVSFTHIIMNPPYKKITTSSEHRQALRSAGIETVNLYAGFVALAVQKLAHDGELIAIIPRSFCNGPYYQSFRSFILKETSITHLHIFDSRSNAFSSDNVLQENIIIHLVKGRQQEDVVITSSPVADFAIDEGTGVVTASDMTTRTVAFEKIVYPNDKANFIHIAANERDQAIIDRLSPFSSTLGELDVQVSTGPVIDFRLKDDLRKDIEDGAVPLIYPVHLNGGVNWPKDSKKPNAISVSEKSRSWLWKHEGHFVIVRRFSAKEEQRRIVATPYNSSLPGGLIGFENKLNVFHNNKKGFDKNLSLGLYVYLNSTLLDKYYRLFGGHTQVNAADLRNIHYPSAESLRRIGKLVDSVTLEQKQIDDLLDGELFVMTGNNNNNPLNTQEKIDQALEIIILLGMPIAQQNERSALTFLALLNLRPEGAWQEIEKPMIGVTPIMDWVRDVYGKEYAPNTRETFRRATLHQFVAGGLVLYNSDKPDRAVNSPKACYQIAPELFDILTTFGTDCWKEGVEKWLGQRETLTAQYAMAREMQMIPLILNDGTEIKLSPGVHG